MAMLKDFIDKNQDNYIGAFCPSKPIELYEPGRNGIYHCPIQRLYPKVGTSSGN